MTLLHLICPTGVVYRRQAQKFSLKKPAPNNQIVEPIQQIYPTGKSPECPSSPFRKNILIFRSCKLSYIDRIPFHSEGRFANVTNVGMGCGGRSGARDGRRQSGRRNRVDPTPRRWCQVCAQARGRRWQESPVTGVSAL